MTGNNMNKVLPIIIFVLSAGLWGVVLSPVLVRIDSGYESVQVAMIVLCATNVLVSLGVKKTLSTEIAVSVTGVLFSLLYTLVICALILLAFQFHKVKYG
jgi:hypothetical protein